MAKWSEMLARLLGDKDVIAEESVAIVQEQPTVQQEQPTAQQEQPTVQQYTKAEFDALNAEINRLKAANQQLILTGSLKSPEKEQTDEDIILDLCVGRRKDGRKWNSEGSDTAER